MGAVRPMTASTADAGDGWAQQQDAVGDVFDVDRELLLPLIEPLCLRTAVDGGGSDEQEPARGALVDDEAVCDALESGRLAAAAFDVYDAEPIPAGSRILKAPNVVLSPHIAGASKQVAHKAAAIAAAEAARFLRGEPPANCANPQVLGSPQMH